MRAPMTARPFASLLLALPAAAAPQGDDPYDPPLREASADGERAIARFTAPEGFRVSLWAAEPMLANPVCFAIDNRGRMFVCETFRHGRGVTDIRDHMDWLDDDLAAASVEDRVEMMRRHEGDGFGDYEVEHERVRLLLDEDGDGAADRSLVYADGFNDAADGIAAGLLVRGDDVYYTCIPSLWKLSDTDGDGVADARAELSTGYGVKVSLLGHDLHGLALGHDGRIYFSIGDRGFHVRTPDETFHYPNTGAVFRCEPDGSGLELFALGLRNPQELAFDDHGNLWTGDNNSDGGDQARWVYVVEGGDSGWRSSYQWITEPELRGPWNAEKLWYPYFDGQAAYIVPPIANVANGPSGLAYYPGTGLPARYREHFFLCDFRGEASISGVHSFTVKPVGAGFELTDLHPFLWGSLVTDVDFGPDSALYVTDWIHGWQKPMGGRAYRIAYGRAENSREVREVAELLGAGFEHRPNPELGSLLSHADRRVRLESQLALAARGRDSLPTLRAAVRQVEKPLKRLHGLWGLGQIARLDEGARTFLARELADCLTDPDPEVRAQAARALADLGDHDPTDALLPLLTDPIPRVRYFAALGLGRGGRSTSIEPLLDLLRKNGGDDPFLRHAGVAALDWIGDVDALLAHADHPSAAARTGILLALRRHARPEIARFLDDPASRLAVEAARAIYDVPIPGAMDALAALAARPASALKDRMESRQAFFRRVLNAACRQGGEVNARAVAALARDGDAPPASRVECVRVLRDWERPSARDRVVYDWRPIVADGEPDRDVGVIDPIAIELARDLLADAEAPSALVQEVLALVSTRRLAPLADAVSAVALDPARRTRERERALEAAAALGGEGLADTLSAVLTDAEPTVAGKASELLGSIGADAALPLLTEVLAQDEVEQQRGALRALAGLRGEAVEGLLRDWVERLADPAAAPAPEVRLEVVLAAEAQGDALADELADWRASFAADDPLGERRVLLHGGDPRNGRKLFFGKPETTCLKCHKVDGQGGSEAGPDLSGIGERRGREHVLRSILDPNAEIAEGFQNVLVWKKDETSVTGQRLGESEDALFLRTADGETVAIPLAEVDEVTADISAMPDGMEQLLTRQELRDIVEFLAGL